MERQFEVRLEERVDERTRIARELHDTLLQSFNGLLLRFRTVHALFSKSPDQARTILENAIDETRQALTEGRQAVQGLWPSAVETHEFSEAIKTLTEELASDLTHSGSAEVRLTVEGTPRKKRLSYVMRSIGLRAKRCETPSVMPRRAVSRCSSATVRRALSFACEMTAKASIRNSLPMRARPGTSACAACASVRNRLAAH